MTRSILAVIVAVVTWFIVATIGHWILRAGLPGYSAVGSLHELHADDDDLPASSGSRVIVVCGFCVRNHRAKQGGGQSGCRCHGCPVSPGSLHVMGQVSDLVSLVLFDFARSDATGWRSASKQGRSRELITRSGTDETWGARLDEGRWN